MSGTVNSFHPLLLVLLPAVFGALILVLPEKLKAGGRTVVAAGAAAILVLEQFDLSRSLEFTRAWAGWGMDFSLKMTAQNGALLIAASALTLLVAAYAILSKALPEKDGLYDANMLFALAMANGALMANNLVAMLFFWQAMWAPVFVMIRAGGKNAWKTSVRAVFTAGLADLSMILGIGFASLAAEGMTIDQMHVADGALGSMGLVLMAVGAVAKVGSVPFHGWLFAAEEDAPSPFMALIPGGLSLLMGTNLLSKFPGMFDMGPSSWAMLMVLAFGAGTAVVSGALSLTAGGYKKLAVALVLAEGGSMILGATSSAGGAFAIAAVFAAAAGSLLFITAGLMEKGGPSKSRPAAFGYWLAALVAAAVAFSGAMVRVALHEGILDLILAVVALVGTLFSAAGALHMARTAFSGAPLDAEPEPEGALGWIAKTRCDPYPAAHALVKGYSNLSLTINDAISWFYDVAVVRLIGFMSLLVKRAHNGSQSRYVLWVFAGAVAVVAIFVLS